MLTEFCPQQCCRVTFVRYFLCHCMTAATYVSEDIDRSEFLYVMCIRHRQCLFIKVKFVYFIYSFQ
jgi:hypothetical protein